MTSQRIPQGAAGDARVSRTARDLPRGGIRAISDLARGREDVVNLLFGEPDFDTPAHIAEAGVAAIARHQTRYAPGRGIAPLRDAIAQSLQARTGRPLTADHVTVTAGGVQALLGALVSLADRGDTVLVPDPGWPNYAGQCAMLGLRAVPYRLRPVDGFEPRLDELEALVSRHRPVAIVINTPSNPTGAVWSRAGVEGVVSLAGRYDTWVISDEVYDEMAFDAEHVPAALSDEARVVTIASFSKTYAMTGWRVGYLTATPEVAALVGKILETEASCASTPSQHAALAAIAGPQDCVRTMREAYASRRDLAVRALDAEGLSCTVPRGAFYALADVSRATEDTAAFARHLALMPHGVACAPGSAFGPGAAGLLRLSLAAAADDIVEGVRRIGHAVREISDGDAAPA
jgi:aspartate aminotransferase